MGANIPCMEEPGPTLLDTDNMIYDYADKLCGDPATLTFKASLT